ncbi:hypothetical protein [Glycomyces buryatensis]|uniref:Uncharacterized protein n=1 Tax=Glycomyces buryatensis TaxID=2570927 RepID=A0A4S8PRS4_9ACTN|nr:hypothetical protein [Glycomyces buryatensis]THV33938.1 hypothetical protein FAB82_24495 [Glycomyces buryatensis]
MGFGDWLAHEAGEAVDAFSGGVDSTVDYIEEQVDTAVDVIAPDPPQAEFRPAPTGEYDIKPVPTKDEIFSLLEQLEGPIRKAITRELAGEHYPDSKAYIAMSLEEFERDGTPGRSELYYWDDSIECVLPTKYAVDSWAASLGKMYPYPDAVAPQVANDSARDSASAIASLYSAFEDAFGSIDLAALADEAELQAKIAKGFGALIEQYQGNLDEIEALGTDWEGADAQEYWDQFGKYVSEAISKHDSMAANLHAAIDLELGIQSSLQWSLYASVLATAHRLGELTKESEFEPGEIKAIAGGGILIGAVSLIPLSGPAALIVGLAGLAAGIAGYAGIEITIDPKIETIPNLEKVNEIVDAVVAGAATAAEDASSGRTGVLDQLASNFGDHQGAIGTPGLVPGCDYFG